MQTDVYARLYRVAALSEGALRAVDRAVDEECVVFCVCEITPPQPHVDAAEVENGVRSECGVEVLVIVVVNVPVGASVAADIGTECQRAQQSGR